MIENKTYIVNLSVDHYDCGCDSIDCLCEQELEFAHDAAVVNNDDNGFVTFTDRDGDLVAMYDAFLVNWVVAE